MVNMDGPVEIKLSIFKNEVTKRWGYSLFVRPCHSQYEGNLDSLEAATSEALAAVSRITGTKLQLKEGSDS